jgi:hypothetical protein
MPFTANWSVIPGERPTTSKWNQLGENDDYLNGLASNTAAALANSLIFFVRDPFPTSWDYNSTLDHAWTTYNAASIIPEGATHALVRAQTNGGSQNKLEFRKDSSVTGTHTTNPSITSPSGASNTDGRNGSFDLLVPITESRTFDHQSPYDGGTPNTSRRRFAVIGWYIPYSVLIA